MAKCRSGEHRVDGECVPKRGSGSFLYMVFVLIIFVLIVMVVLNVVEWLLGGGLLTAIVIIFLLYWFYTEGQKRR